MNTKACTVGGLVLSVNSLPCYGNPCLTWVGHPWGLESLFAESTLDSHRQGWPSRTWLWGFQLPSFLDIQSVLADLSPVVMEHNMWARGVQSHKAECAFESLFPTSSGAWDGESGYGYWFSLGAGRSVNRLRSGGGQMQGPSKMCARELRLKGWGLSLSHISVNLPFLPPSCRE